MNEGTYADCLQLSPDDSLKAPTWISLSLSLYPQVVIIIPCLLVKITTLKKKNDSRVSMAIERNGSLYTITSSFHLQSDQCCI